MALYASQIGRDPEAIYRQIDASGKTVGADGPELVQLLYDEATASLRSAAWAAENGRYALKSEKVTRATAILFALEAGLDFDKGAEIAHTLSRLYAGARASIVEASVGSDPAPFRAVAQTLGEVADAWRQVRAA